MMRFGNFCAKRKVPTRKSDQRRQMDLFRLINALRGDKSIDPRVESAAIAEAERRLRAVEVGEEEAIPGDDVMRELRRIVSG